MTDSVFDHTTCIPTDIGFTRSHTHPGHQGTWLFASEATPRDLADAAGSRSAAMAGWTPPQGEEEPPDEHTGPGHDDVLLSLVTVTGDGGRVYRSWTICECSPLLARLEPLLGPPQMETYATADAAATLIEVVAGQPGRIHLLGSEEPENVTPGSAETRAPS
jgi:hypothetical protein